MGIQLYLHVGLDTGQKQKYKHLFGTTALEIVGQINQLLGNRARDRLLYAN